MKKFFKSEKYRYLFLGGAFGLIFPILSTTAHLIHMGQSLTISNAISMQLSEPLFWIIDTAPILLGYFAMFGGIQLDRINIYNHELEDTVKRRTSQLMSELEVHKKLVVEKADALLDAENSKIELEKTLKKV